MKDLAIKLVLVLAGLVFGLFLVEIFLRVVGNPFAYRGTQFASLNDLRRAMLKPDGATPAGAPDGLDANNLRVLVNPHPDDRIIFDLKPNLDVTFQRVPVRTNACGMRYRDVPLVKPPGTYRIAMLGDSFAFGWGVAQDQTFAARIEQNLNRIAGGKIHYEVLNFGVPGYSTFQEVALFKERVLDFDPDAVVVFFVQNDFELPFYVKDIYRPGGIVSATEFLRMGAQALDPNLNAERLTMQGLDPNSALTELSEICRARGIPLFLTINPRKEWKQWRDRLPVLRARRDIQQINMRADFMRIVRLRNIPVEALTLPTDPHPSALRHAIYGDLMTTAFMGTTMGPLASLNGEDHPAQLQ